MRTLEELRRREQACYDVWVDSATETGRLQAAWESATFEREDAEDSIMPGSIEDVQNGPYYKPRC